ncbi:MAG: glycosyltransferase family 4 protein [Rhodoplanes sp.]
MADSSELTAPEVYRMWRRKGRASLAALADGVALSSGRIEAIGYRDVADGLMGLFGPHRWVWRDKRGREIAGGWLPVALFRIGLDVASLPLVLALHRRHARAILRKGPRDAAWMEDRPPAYLRMDHLFDLRAGGSVAHTSGVINAMRKLLGRVVIISTDRLALVEPDDDFHFLTPRYGVGRNLALVPQLTYNQQVARWWRRNRFSPAFVYGRYSLGNYAAAMIAQREGVPYVCEYNGSNIWISRNWDTSRMPFEGLMALIEDANLFAADLIVAVSKPSKDELVGRGVPAERIIVNPNGVDPQIYRPGRDGEPVRRKLGIARDEVVIAFIGTFGNWHGAEVLADAFARMLANNPDLGARARLLLIGDGGKMPLVREILQRSGAIERTILTGTVPQPEAPDYLAAADVFASPHVPNPDGTPFFGSPTKLFEYMAMGRAIVASNLDQIGEILTHGETAFLVPPADADALAEGMAVLARDAELRHRLGAAARNRCLADFTWEQHTKRILDALRQVGDRAARRIAA